MFMSGKSRKNSPAIDRPFEAGVLRRARDIAERYQVVIQEEDGEFLGRGLEMPLVMGDGTTPGACMENTREALVVAVAYLLEEGRVPPVPAVEQTRSVQVNIRLTAAEKETLEQAARRKGFRGVSDYVRHAALGDEG